MLRIYVDFNAREVHPHVESVAIPLHTDRAEEYKAHLFEGRRVIIFDEGTECEAMLRRGTSFPWVADIIPNTLKDNSGQR
jgi:hypothetical protein